MRISTRLFLYVFGVIAVLGVALSYVSVRDERAHLLSESRSRAHLFARTVAAVLKYYHPVGPAVDMETILSEVAADAPTAIPYLRLYGADGAPLELTCTTCQTPPIPLPDVGSDTLPPEGREATVVQGRDTYLQVLLPILDARGMFQGAVEVILPLRHVGRALAGVVRRFLLFGSAGAVVLAAVLLLIARWSIAAPLQRLQEAARDLGSGDLSLRLDPSGVTDIDELIAEFNRMAQGMEEQSVSRERAHLRRLELERDLRHADRLASIGQLTSGLAHELGTPLNVISGRAEQLLAKLPPGDSSRKALETVLRQAEHIAGIIDRLLAFSRKGAGNFTEIDLHALAREAFSLCRLRATETLGELKLETGPSTAAVSMMGDAAALQQLLVNLMLNSFQAMQGDGIVRVAASIEADDRLRIVYEDTGPGIPAEDRERVFDPFFTTKEVGEGTGLGLYIVANIVGEHRGEIRTEEAAGGGARFVITFPRERVGAVADAARENPAPTGGGAA